MLVYVISFLIYCRKKMKVKFKRFSSHACVPTKSTPGSACSDVYSARNISLGPGVTKNIKLDLGFTFAKKYFCRIYPRSGLSLKPLFLSDWVIDSNYRVNVSVILTSFSSWNIDIEKGDRISQFFLRKRKLTL